MSSLLDIKAQHAVRVLSAIVGFVIIVGYLVLAIFTDSIIVFYVGSKIALIFATFNIILAATFKDFYEKTPGLALGLLLISNCILPLILLDYLGGPLTAFVFILYLVQIINFLFATNYGIIMTVMVSAYIVFSYYTHPGIASNYLIILGSIAFSGTAFGYLGHRYHKTVAVSEELENNNLALTANQNKEEALLAGIADGVYVVDMNRNITMFNDSAADMTGWTKNEAIGLKCSTVMNLKNETDASICQKDCPAMAVWNTGENIIRDDTCFAKKRGNKKVQISSSYSPIKDKNGKLTGAICVFRDVTAKKEVERLRNEFVSTASHELRTPITAIEGYLELIENEKICKIDGKAKEYSEKARNTALGMSNLVKNLLTVTKIEEGKIQTNITHFSIHDLAAEVVEAMTPSAIKKNLSLKIVEAPNQKIRGEKTIGRSLNVVADKEQIREVFYNIIENGLKFTTEGGVTVSIIYDEDNATVEIADTGSGIPAEGQKHLFEKFYRVDNTATREVGGTGLGLFITRSIIENFGGTIWIESQVNKGTKFFFTIPRSLD